MRMEKKVFSGKKIIIRKISRKDLKNARNFLDFINSFIAEDAKILINKKLSLKEEKEWLGECLKKLKRKKEVKLMAEHNGIIVGLTGIDSGRWRESHVGNFGITIRKGYRGIGLGKYLMEEIIKLAKKELKPRLKIIRLSVYSNNKLAIALYKKYGFKGVAKIPKQIQYKEKLVDEIIMLLYL
jgi:ribosomal protein S18 acetylase RimI-like enzyme